MASASAEANTLGAVEVNGAAQPQQSSAGSAQGQATLPHSSDTAPALDKVPDDVLLEIFTLLDNPRSLSLTSKRFVTASKDRFFRARWFLNRFPSYRVIFEAIARPKLFDADLLERLIKGGAQLSRSLAQFLHLLHNDSTLTGQHETRWGVKISFTAYLAVLHKAEQLFRNISFDAHNFDDLKFTEGLIDSELPLHGAALSDATALMNKFHYMPLPLSLSEYAVVDEHVVISVQRNEAHAVEAVLYLAPGLAPLMQSKGYEIDFKGSLWLCRKLFSVGLSRRNLESRLQALQAYGLLHIPRNVASNIILALRPNVAADGLAASSRSAVLNYEVLLEMDRTSGLEFVLEDVVTAIVSHFKQGSVDATVIPLIERLAQDFPRVELSAVFVRAMFVKAEYQKLTHLDAVAALMGRHKVTTEDVMQACLRNASKSTLPIQYAARYIEGFNMETFLAELVESLLNQPYRGKMLRELELLPEAFERNDLPPGSIDFRTMLAEAVERRAFTHRDIPEQQWYSSRPWSGPVFNSVPSARSFLSRGWMEGQNARPITLRSITSKKCARKTKPTDLPGFTEFITQEQARIRAEAAAAAEAEAAATQEQHPDTESNGERNDANEGAAAHISHTAGLGRVEFIRLQDVPDLASTNPTYDNVTSDEAIELLSQRFQNGRGPIPDDAENIALVVVELLGADSKSADVCLAHSFLNGNVELSQELIKRGVSLTFEHFKIAAKLDYRLPSSLLDYVKSGAPFKAAFEAPENEPDKMWKYRAGLTEEIRRKCRTLADSAANSQGGRRFFSVNIDEAGKLCIEKIDALRKDVVKQIISHSAPASASPVDNAADDNVSELSDVPMEDAGGGATAASAAGERQIEETLVEADTSIAQRIKRSSRKSRPTSFAESVKDESDSDDGGSAANASSFIVTIEGIPTIILRDDLQRRLQSTKLWLQHLELLRRQHDDIATALYMITVSSTYVRTWQNAAGREIAAMLGSITKLVRAYKRAKPAVQDAALVAELNELYEELDSAETPENADAFKSLTSRKAKDLKIFKRSRRKAFQKSPFSVRERQPGWWRRGEREQWQRRKEGWTPLSDEDSEDENFEASLTQSDSGYSTSSDSSASSESEAESEPSDAEPAPKRAKTGRNTSSAKPNGSSKKSAESNGKRKATSAAAKGKGRKRVRSSSSSEEESSSSDSDNEGAAVSNTQVGSSSKMQAMASGSGSNIANASPADDDAEPEESTHPVYDHHLFNDEEFQGILTAIRADGLDDAAAEALYLEELLDMELDDDSDEEAD